MSKVIKKPHAVADLESAIVRLVRTRGEVSRSELARVLGLVASTAGIYVDRLIETGYLVESRGRASSAGRPPVMISLNPLGGRFIGVDFDASEVLVMAVDFAHRPLARIRRGIPAGAKPERIVNIIKEAIRGAIGPDGPEVLGIGVGVPGLVDADQGISRAYRFLPDWKDVPVRDLLMKTFRVPVFVENNSRALALGELWCGQGRGLRNLVCLNVRWGIGSGIIVDGALLKGSNNQAGEVGGWACPEEGPVGRPVEGTERVRTIEDEASVSSLLASFGGEGEATLSGLLEEADRGDRRALGLVESAAFYHAWVLHQLAMVFDPDRLILAGPMVESWPYCETVLASTIRLAGREVGRRVSVSALGPFAGALGASALAFHLWRPRR